MTPNNVVQINYKPRPHAVDFHARHQKSAIMVWHRRAGKTVASIADLLSDVAQAEVARDVNEVRDINAAQARIAAGTYGTCIDCGQPIGKARLEAYPTAKRCIADQERREKLRAGAPHGARL